MLESAQDRAEFAGCPAACFGGACCGGDCDVTKYKCQRVRSAFTLNKPRKKKEEEEEEEEGEGDKGGKGMHAQAGSNVSISTLK